MSNAAKHILNKLRPWVSRKWSSNEPHIGIGLGNAHTYVSVMEDNKAKLIKKGESRYVLTSSDPGEVGLENCKCKRYGFAAFGVKQLLGAKFDDPLVQKEIQRDPFPKHIVRGPDGYVSFKDAATGDLHQPVTILANRVLGPMREDAQSYLGKSVSKAVVALPSSFSDSQVTAALEVCRNAGIRLVQPIEEAMAAAIAYGMHKEKEGTVFAVVDMGDRTFHVSILEVDSNGKFVSKGFPKSDMFLGGVEFDNMVMEFLSKEGKRIMGRVLQEDAHILKQMYASESVKVHLSFYAAISLPLRPPTILTRKEFEGWVTILIDRVKAHCVNCLKDAHVDSKDVDQVLLVGGMTNMPIVLKAVFEVFDKSPRMGVNPSEAVSLGAAAAIQAGVLGGDDWVSLEMV